MSSEKLVITVPKGCLVYEHLWDVQVAYAILHTIVHSIAGITEIAKIAVPGQHTGKLIVMPFEGILQIASSGNHPDNLLFEITDFNISKPHLHEDNKSDFARPLWAMLDGLFSIFVERCNNWLKYDKFFNDYQNWPPVNNFCRVVRNAVVHGSKISIKNKSAPLVSWRGLNYSSANYGQNIFDDLSGGDFILLAIDFFLEMKELGAPDNFFSAKL